MQQLINLAHLVAPARPFDWQQAEERLQAPVPPDYRALVAAGGGGLWLDYVRVFRPTPGPGYRHVDLAESALVWLDLEDARVDEAWRPPGDLSEEARLLPWASTGAGVSFYWEVIDGVPPERYPIRISDRDGDLWQRYDLLTTDLLLGIVRGEIRDQVLNPSWIDDQKIFRPYRA
ncbi:SMI1/KNR4 family protein [Antribacter sp. KLBMP9083]|uniref:SMI1/KNR4 family protein n=1 Tax=Antribacter soli TaxID=2910976 RepID=A0AA41QC94_9MICO|nr:SMI1/KNR4 family protein [Antribacter soli]MCF4120790.1 SMI1/KNR4 family protein [Antribacter soli]